jgi:hypothetical protein
MGIREYPSLISLPYITMINGSFKNGNITDWNQTQ